MTDKGYTFGYFGYLANDEIDRMLSVRKAYSPETASAIVTPIPSKIGFPSGVFFTPEEFYNTIKLPLGLVSASNNVSDEEDSDEVI